MKTIVITRPKGDEKLITDLLHAHGYRVIHEPLTDIFLRHTERQVVHNAIMAEPDAVLVTSRHAVQALSLLTDLRDAYLLCVGEATAQMATSLGFTRTASAGGTVNKMIEYVLDGYDAGSSFFYPSGEFVRGNMDVVLIQSGMQVERCVVYDAIAAQQISDTLVEQIRRKQVDAVTFLSARAAQIFTQLLTKAGAQQSVQHLHGFCLSETIAAPLRQQPWKAIDISDQPTLASLLECIDNRFSQQE